MAKTLSQKPVRRAAKAARKSNASPLEGVEVRLTHPERVLFAETGLTKLGLATYYAQVAPWILPHLVDRPLSLVRCPEGQKKKCFYQKHATPGTPEALGRVKIQESDGVEEYLYVRDLQGLLALPQLSILEIHPWGSRRDQLEKPDYLVFDLDPDPSVPWERVVEAAFEVRRLLAERDLQSFVKTTGGKGLHVCMPLSPRRTEWGDAKAFTRSVAEQLVAGAPKLYTVNMSKAARQGKIFVDYLRNDRGATAVAPYSTRAKPNAAVSAPLTWKELTPAITSDHFHVGNIVPRLEKLKSDPWADFGKIKQSLPRRKK